MSKLAEIFKNSRIVALAGEKNSGKTNNLIYLIKEFRETDKKTPIYVFGMPDSVMKYLRTKLNVKEISQLRHLIQKKDCLLILDECQKLKLNDSRYREELDEFTDFVYHNNVYVILSSPNIRSFNSVIGGVVEKWLLKSVKVDECINGSQLKKVILNYKGRYKEMDCLEMPKNEILVVNNCEELVIDCDYVSEADDKKANINIFVEKNTQRKNTEKTQRKNPENTQKKLE
jgi:hypothetical protein